MAPVPAITRLVETHHHSRVPQLAHTPRRPAEALHEAPLQSAQFRWVRLQRPNHDRTKLRDSACYLYQVPLRAVRRRKFHPPTVHRSLLRDYERLAILGRILELRLSELLSRVSPSDAS